MYTRIYTLIHLYTHTFTHTLLHKFGLRRLFFASQMKFLYLQSVFLVFLFLFCSSLSFLLLLLNEKVTRLKKMKIRNTIPKQNTGKRENKKKEVTKNALRNFFELFLFLFCFFFCNFCFPFNLFSRFRLK